MTPVDPLARRPAPPSRRRWPRRLALVVTGVLLLALGVAIGRALEDGPAPGGTQTSVRTLEPLPQHPATTTP